MVLLRNGTPDIFRIPLLAEWRRLDEAGRIQHKAHNVHHASVHGESETGSWVERDGKMKIFEVKRRSKIQS